MLDKQAVSEIQQKQKTVLALADLGMYGQLGVLAQGHALEVYSFDQGLTTAIWHPKAKHKLATLIQVHMEPGLHGVLAL